MKFVQVAVILTLLLGAALQAISQSGDETKLLALENAWDQAAEIGDMKSISMLVDDTLVNIDDRGHLENKAQYMARIKSEGLLSKGSERGVNEFQSAHIYGNCGVISGIYSRKGVKDRKPYMHRSRFTETWIYKNGIWVAVAAPMTPILDKNR
jgi:hypothetical protein